MRGIGGTGRVTTLDDFSLSAPLAAVLAHDIKKIIQGEALTENAAEIACLTEGGDLPENHARVVLPEIERHLNPEPSVIDQRHFMQRAHKGAFIDRLALHIHAALPENDRPMFRVLRWIGQDRRRHEFFGEIVRVVVDADGVMPTSWNAVI